MYVSLLFGGIYLTGFCLTNVTVFVVISNYHLFEAMHVHIFDSAYVKPHG